MIQGYEDGTKDDIPESVAGSEGQNAPSLTKYQKHHGSLSPEPSPKRPRLSPSKQTTPVVTFGGPRTPVKNHASIQQFHGGRMLSPAQITNKIGSLPIRSIPASAIQKNIITSVRPQVSTHMLQPGTVSEILPQNVSGSATSLTQLLLSESPASKVPLVIATSPSKLAISPKSISFRDKMSRGPEIANILRQHVNLPPPAAPVLMAPPSDVTSVHSYSLASASSVTISGDKILVSPSVLRTSALQMKRPRTAVYYDESTIVYKVMSRLVSRVTRFRNAVKVIKPLPTTDDGKLDDNIPTLSTVLRPKIKIEKGVAISEELARKRNKLKCILHARSQRFRVRYYELQTEYFFLMTGGNLVDYPSFQKKPPSPALIEYLKSHPFNACEMEMHLLSDILTSRVTALSVPSTVPSMNPGTSKEQIGSFPNVSSQLLTARLLSAPSNLCSPRGGNPSSLSDSLLATNARSPNKLLGSPKLSSKHNSLSAVYDSTIGSQEEIVERAKQEAYVMQRIGDLRKEGLWSLKKLPKVHETARSKGHWDYLLEEMAWLAADFVQERKWKKAAAKKCARMVLKYFQEKDMRAEKAEKEQSMRLRRIASLMAKEIRTFWANIEKLVEFKQQTWLDAKKKQVLDSHLNFIVDQTEKYSSWLTQGLNRQIIESTGTSRASSPPTNSSRKRTYPGCDDDEFRPESSESDNEETIDKEEAAMSEYDDAEEIKLLQQESELSIENLLETLPKEVLEKPASLLGSESSDEDGDLPLKKHISDDKDFSFTKNGEEEDHEFEVPSSEEEDLEETLIEQEEKEKNVNYAEELKELKEENELSVQELYEKYKKAYASDAEVMSNSECSEIEEMDLSPDSNEKSNISADDHKTDETSDIFKSDDKNPSKEITDIAATAESFQPKGNTLSTTQVCTKIPFLLKHQLREYQHIGLDWMNAMFEKKLNGILADEMGLGKTIQTISILSHLACEKGIWGPHLIVVPTSVMLNWEMEIKKWCPAFKILTYYGTPKERKQKRIGWTKPNIFHICITSYKLVVQDHQSFRRKRWIYLILDEAQHIKNFKSQRWQMLLNFQSTHRLLLTGTPLQNNLMELWSLMHFLMPNVFQSHRDFREWFVNPVTGMIEGNHEYNDSLIKRLHKVLRPFLLRRLKCEVEKQLPKKYEHVVMCRLSKRQRYLYDDFMGQTKTKDTLATGSFMSVINILMQLRKVCNHPNMFDPRPIVSPFMMKGITFVTASPVWSALDYDPFKHISLGNLNLLLANIELSVTAFAAHRTKHFQTMPHIIENIDTAPDPPPPVPRGKIRLTITGSSQPLANISNQQRISSIQQARNIPVSTINRAMPPFNTSLMHPQRYVTVPSQTNSTPTSRTVSPVAAVNSQQVLNQQAPSSAEFTLQLVQQPSTGLPVAQLAPISNQVSSGPFTVQIPAGGGRTMSIGRLIQTSSGQHLLITPSVPTSATESQPSTSSVAAVSYSPLVHTTSPGVMPSTSTANVAMATVLPQMQKGVSPMQSVLPNIVATFTRPQNVLPSSVTGLTSQTVYNKPIGRVAPMNIHPPANSLSSVTTHNATKSPIMFPVTRSQPKPKIEVPIKSRIQQKRESLFHLETLAARQTENRLDKLRSLGQINIFRCSACPVYGRDLIEAVTVTNNIRHSSKSSSGGRCYVNCLNAPLIGNRPRCMKHYTKYLSDLIETPESYIRKLLDIITRFVFVVPPVTAPGIQMHVSHPPPSKLNGQRVLIQEINSRLSAPCALVHPIVSAQRTQFPDTRLIEYDCGKLQRLAQLLYELKCDHHRILIFTQMTRMLDILEQFLSYHAHTYLRLDGNTKVEMRQALMERFNNDKRIFCFILSTRSGGIGVNLTGADTVIFYDSDWNPTMDAQAQDRCHRIGQTRDVHIYRLISERTVEENILKKANQKRMLGNLAIEGGNFTTAFFKEKTIHELFSTDTPLSELVAKVEVVPEESTADSSLVSEAPETFSQVQLEQALGMAEEELDLKAATVARDEAAAELAEFDESIPFDNDSRDNEDKSPAEEEFDRVLGQLTPVERYAVRFYESLQDPISLEQLKQAEEEIAAQKHNWELDRLKALKEEQERRDEQDGLLNDEPLLYYGRENVSNQVSKSNSSSKLKRRSNAQGDVAKSVPKRRSLRITSQKDKHESDSDSNESDKHNFNQSKPRTNPRKIIMNAKQNLTNGPSKPKNQTINNSTVNAKSLIISPKLIDNRNLTLNNKNNVSTPVVAKPFSNPNLVIRTRRASAIEAEEKSRSESESEQLTGSPGRSNAEDSLCSSLDISFTSPLSKIISENREAFDTSVTDGFPC